jgi:hypothetical protein
VSVTETGVRVVVVRIREARGCRPQLQDDQVPKHLILRVLLESLQIEPPIVLHGLLLRWQVVVTAEQTMKVH